MKNYAYVTLLTNDAYAPMAVALFLCNKLVKSDYPLYCIVTPEVSQKVLEAFDKIGFNYFLRPNFPVPQNIIDINNSKYYYPKWAPCFNKFWLFELPFDKVIYLDSDLFVVKNIDELFDCEDYTAAPDTNGIEYEHLMKDAMHENPAYRNYFNAGLLVLTPSKYTFEEIRQELAAWDQYHCNDQNFLALKMIPEWKDRPNLQLSPIYNLMAPFAVQYFDSQKEYTPLDVKVWHFCGKKPIPGYETVETNAVEKPLYEVWARLVAEGQKILA